jgi:uncharacterized protein DUF6516
VKANYCAHKSNRNARVRKPEVSDEEQRACFDLSAILRVGISRTSTFSSSRNDETVEHGERLTTSQGVVILSNMQTTPLLHERRVVAEGAFAELVVWQVPSPVPGSTHGFKYRLAFVVNGVCLLRYDNEAGKGDHKHIGGEQRPYSFTTPAQLLEDFWNDVDHWRS